MTIISEPMDAIDFVIDHLPMVGNVHFRNFTLSAFPCGQLLISE